MWKSNKWKQNMQMRQDWVSGDKLLHLLGMNQLGGKGHDNPHRTSGIFPHAIFYCIFQTQQCLWINHFFGFSSDHQTAYKPFEGLLDPQRPARYACCLDIPPQADPGRHLPTYNWSSTGPSLLCVAAGQLPVVTHLQCCWKWIIGHQSLLTSVSWAY